MSHFSLSPPSCLMLYFCNKISWLEGASQIITSQNIVVHNSGRWKNLTLTRLTFSLIFYWHIYRLQQQWPHEQRVVSLCYGMPHLFESWIALSTWNITVQGISVRELKCVIQWIGNFPADSVIHFSNNWGKTENDQNKWPRCMSIWILKQQRRIPCFVYSFLGGAFPDIFNTWSLLTRGGGGSYICI